jgi:hypothetical protein
MIVNHLDKGLEAGRSGILRIPSLFKIPVDVTSQMPRGDLFKRTDL